MKVRTIAVSILVVLCVLTHLAWGEIQMTWEEMGSALVNIGSHGWSAVLNGSLMDPSELSIHGQILWEFRLPRVITSSATGVLLGWLGLLMQTWFRNPLAGPGVLGITSGGTLGVGLAVLYGILIPSWLAAAIGCISVLMLIGLGARRFSSPVTTLVFGLMISYVVSALVTILQSSASAENLQTFVFWGMGTFAKTTMLPALGLVFAVGLLWVWLQWRSHWLDAWMLGDDIATSMGVPRARFNAEVLLLAGLVVGLVTSLCGPLAFLGLATPHVYRFFHPQRSHRQSMMGIAAWGCVLAMVADGVVRWTDASGMWHWPLNAVLAMLGAPVVLSVLWKRTHDWA